MFWLLSIHFHQIKWCPPWLCVYLNPTVFFLCRLRRKHGRSIIWREWPMKCTLSTCPVPLWGFHFLQFVSKYASALKHGSFTACRYSVYKHIVVSIIKALINIFLIYCQIYCKPELSHVLTRHDVIHFQRQTVCLSTLNVKLLLDTVTASWNKFDI